MRTLYIASWAFANVYYSHSLVIKLSEEYYETDKTPLQAACDVIDGYADQALAT